MLLKGAVSFIACYNLSCSILFSKLQIKVFPPRRVASTLDQEEVWLSKFQMLAKTVKTMIKIAQHPLSLPERLEA